MRISDWSSDVCSSDLDLAWSQRAGGDRHPATFRTGGEEGIADIGMDETDFHSVHFSIFPSHFEQCMQALRLVFALIRQRATAYRQCRERYKDAADEDHHHALYQLEATSKAEARENSEEGGVRKR